MASFSNGSLSGEVSNKRPLENGHMPKYKPRKVSAIRDFPPRCGHNAVPMNLKPEENGSAEAGIMDAAGVKNSEMTDAVVPNGAEISGMADLVESQAVGNSEMPKIAKLNEIKDSQIPNVMVPNGVENSIIEVECRSHEALNSSVDVKVTESLDALAQKVMTNVNVSKDGSHKHEAVNNRVEVERDELVDTQMGNMTTAIANNFSNEVEDLIPKTNLIGVGTLDGMKRVTDSGDQSTLKELNELKGFALVQNSGVEEAKSTLDADAKVEKELLLGNPQELSSFCGSTKPETSFRPKDKYRPRRVSALRDFPPHCGRQPLPVEEEKQIVLSGNDCLNSTENVELAPEEAMPRTVSERGTMGEVLTTPQRECLDGLHNIPVKNETETLNDGAGRGLLGETAEMGLMDFENCNRNLQHGIIERTEASPGSGAISKAVVNTSIKDTEGPVGKETEFMPEITPISMLKAVLDNSDNDYAGPIAKDIVVYSPGEMDEMRPSDNVFISEDELYREVVHCLEAAPYCPWRNGKTVSSNFDGGKNREKKKKQNLSWRRKGKSVARKSNPKIQSSGLASKKRNKVLISNDVDGSPSALMPADDEGHGHDVDFSPNSPADYKLQDFEVSLPPFGPSSSGHVDARNKVRETLRWFHAVYRKFLHQEEAKSVGGGEGKSGKKNRRIDLLTANLLKNKGKLVNTVKMIGQVPGVEVGDEFQYRVELAVVGLHFPYQSGIDSMKLNEVPVATSIVASGGYSDDLENADELIYSGQGGNVMGKAKEPEDQKLERGNLALRNSIAAQTPVRVVRGWKETKIVDPLDPKPKTVTTYIYDGLYTVTNYWIETGPRGKKVFMFKLTRNPGQPELAWKELKKSNKFKTRPGTCVTDISGGKEPFPICAVNSLDSEKPPPFNYISKMMYPDWYCPTPPAGCDCTGRCSDSKKCQCAVRNGGEIPYNRNGALVETKPVVYECGPHCKCPPSCYNRVTQRGIKFQLEVFKTESRGWGVRPLTSIPSGSFICEYAGELLEDKEAEQRIGNDEYLFDIGQNYIDSSKGEEQEIAVELMEEGGFTIDACQYGNVGRFINHSCLPNLHAQNVICDHDDKRMPHIMLFAMDNIPPLQELTYHYNYSVDEIRDSDGNIKVKKCYCGAAECTGRMY